MDLAKLLAQGATAEGVVRSLANYLDQEWVNGFNDYNDPAGTDLSRERAWGRLLAVHAPRAVVKAVVELWDAERPTSTPAVHIVDSR